MATRNDPTKQDDKNKHQFLDYMAIYPNAVVRFHTSDMILRADTHVSYMTELEARSHAAGCLFLGIIPSKCAWEHLNGPIHITCNTFKFIASSAEE